MASLYIKDPETAALAGTLARRTGQTKTEAVRNALRNALDALGNEPDTSVQVGETLAWLDAYRREHPLPPPTGLKADKAFFDALWDET